MQSSTPLSSFRVRPRFRVYVASNPEAVRTRLMAALADLPVGLVARDFPGLIGLHITEDRRHYWSPRLLLNIDPQPDGTSCIVGIYGPEPEVWSIFLYGYIFSGMIGIFSAIMGGAQILVSSTPWALWITGAMVLMAAGLYIAAQLGQKMGAWQTFQIHEVWRGAADRIGAFPAGD
jgi:hypothetical protein